MRVAALAIFGVVGAWTCARADVTAAPIEPPPAPAYTAQSQVAAKSEYENRLICKRTSSTGSLLSKKTCKTQAQIDAERREGQRLLQNQRRTGSGSRGTAVLSDF